MQKMIALLVCAIVCACASSVSDSGAQNQYPEKQGLSGRELFFSDSIYVYSGFRPYPVPETAGTPAPKGYKPVYVSLYARHGSRRLHSTRYTESMMAVLNEADSLGRLTPLGKELISKILIIDNDMRVAGWEYELTPAGERQHKGIAERMYRNYPQVFSRKGAAARLYSTVTQRTMMSMFACNERLMELNPKLKFTRQASGALKYLERTPVHPDGMPLKMTERGFIHEYFDARPVLDKLFTGEIPSLKDTSAFIINLYQCGSVVATLDYENIDILWDLFSYDELFTIYQATNYQTYVTNSNCPVRGDWYLNAIKPLLKDIIDKADEALEKDVPGADLRFGHDSFLISLYALLELNEPVLRVDDPLKVIDTFQAFKITPMAANFQMVFYRNRAGDVLVKILQNEIESSLPIETDMFPYYHWDNVRAYCLGLLDTAFE